MRVVALDACRLDREIVDVAAGGIEDEPRRLAWLAGELLTRLVEMVAVEVGVAERVDELARPQTGDLRDHVGQQGVGGEVERHTEEDVTGPLVELTRQSPVRD